MQSHEFLAFLWAHVLQFTIGISLVAVAIVLTGRKWPQLTFLLCMLALAKCLVPPLITSPAGFFTRHESVAFSPQLAQWDEADVVRLKQHAAPGSESSLEQSAASDPCVIDSVFQLAFGGVEKESVIESTPGRWWLVLLALWSLGAVLIAARALHQAWRLRAMIDGMPAAAQPVQAIAEELHHQLGLRRPVDVLISEQNYGPACVGLWRTKMVLPRVMCERFPDRLLRPVIAHELVHARRGDMLWGYIQFLAQILWWFHPLVWWLGRRASDLCERCCDQEVIAWSHCKPGDYAESLVRVLELKNSLRNMPLGHAMSPIQITRGRVQGIMQNHSQHSAWANLACWILAAVFGCLVIPGVRWASAQEGSGEQQEIERAVKEQETRLQVNRAIGRKDWDTAIALLAPVVAAESQNAAAIFYLGYVVHAKGDYQQALELHQRAAGFPSTRPLALYNWACALALLGRPSEAIARLKEAINAGFVPRGDLAGDTDLLSLSTHAEFQEMRAQQKLYRELDFLVGDWTLRSSAGHKLGSHNISLQQKGYLLMEHWSAVDGGSGTSVTYRQPLADTWRQSHVHDNGHVLDYSGNLQDGQLRLTGTSMSNSGMAVACRLTFVPQADGTIERKFELSDDGGQTWQLAQIAFMVREREPQRDKPQSQRERVATIFPIGQTAE